MERYENRIYGFVTNICRNPADAQDITQDTFVKAWRALDRFDPRHSFSTWLFTIGRRKCIDHYRAAPPPATEPLPDLPHADDPADLLARREDCLCLWGRARECLPAAQYETLWLRYAEDMDVPDIARVVGKTRIHVKVLLFRARQKLARELRSDRPPGSNVPGVVTDADARVRRRAPAAAQAVAEDPSGLAVTAEKGSL